MFKGSIVALITPFKNSVVDQDKYTALIHHHIASGTNGLVPAGTTGESPTLSHDEHKRVIEISVRECKGKIPVIAGTGSNSTAEAVELSKHAEKSGANGLLIVTLNDCIALIKSVLKSLFSLKMKIKIKLLVLLRKIELLILPHLRNLRKLLL